MGCETDTYTDRYSKRCWNSGGGGLVKEDWGGGAFSCSKLRQLFGWARSMQEGQYGKKVR